MRESKDYWRWRVEQAVLDWTEKKLLNDSSLFPNWKDLDYSEAVKLVLTQKQNVRDYDRFVRWIKTSLKEKCKDFFNELNKLNEDNNKAMLEWWFEEAFIKRAALNPRFLRTIGKDSYNTTNQLFCVFQYENKFGNKFLSWKSMVFNWDWHYEEPNLMQVKEGVEIGDKKIIKIPDELAILNSLNSSFTTLNSVNPTISVYWETVNLSQYIKHPHLIDKISV